MLSVLTTLTIIIIMKMMGMGETLGGNGYVYGIDSGNGFKGYT